MRWRRVWQRVGFCSHGNLVCILLGSICNHGILERGYRRQRLRATQFGDQPELLLRNRASNEVPSPDSDLGIVAGTVSLFIQILEGISHSDDSPIPIRIVAGLASFVLGIAWWIVTFFMIPMIVLERSGVLDGMGKSTELFKKTWGEDVTTHIGTGLLMTLSILILTVVTLPLFWLGDVGFILGMVILAVGFLFAVLFFSTVEVVNRASLFYYAKTGQSPPMAEKYGLSFR